MQLIQLYNENSLRNFSYLIKAESDNICICVDPFDSELIIRYCEENAIQITHVLNTHQHHDHIKGNTRLLDFYGAKILSMQDGEVLKLDEVEMVSHQSYGHTMDHYIFTFKEDGRVLYALTGDTIFGAGVGNCKNGGEPSILFNTVRKIQSEFQKETILYTGHDYLENNLNFVKSIWQDNSKVDFYLDKVVHQKAKGNFVNNTFQEEKEMNPFFNLDIFQKKYQLSSEEETFLMLRKQRDQW